ncbi:MULTISPECIES: sugar ABC transporter substrate-binding protein [unclassified Mesorhizobium]|uniref:sugar ABC transporter substrate-binding protein n=1 Tax=unclassified Mesorhizobium TaxID=325217 RepID=UPI000FD9ADD4|nr:MULTISPECIES: sugar ABC transporter substrate-binding protein [unclassified Mesorhizobium]TGR23023.1 hypothetical protein EN840_21345 [Mesorhizobium sp. M8A.F.Ca.ET.197.01.1.1]TGR39109.1 hypothetical protein EN842_41385 [bacterium M00.F.Ca.ET.199.01.1.1]TGR46702.1 hypothetical protein EN841_21335 [Mesorhizobium sp. M8A.F.Ca.ET.198.01.1.1]TGV85224.1 hypothetical protein EN792_019135 [Mesorhizobium sp. M00.F.Ca.ET.149.01.1.1]
MNLNHTVASLGLIATLSFGTALTAFAQDVPEFLKGRELKKPLNELTIGYSALGRGTNSYSAIVFDIMEQRSKELGIHLVILDGGADPGLQAQQIPTMITKKADVAVVWPINSGAIMPSIKLLHNANIPILILDSRIPKEGDGMTVAFTGADHYKEAYNTGMLMGEALGGKGNVLEITGLPGYDVTQARIDGIGDALKTFPDIKVLDIQPADWSQEKGQTLTESWITRFGFQIDGIVSADGGSGTGAMNAVRDAVNDGRIEKGHIKFTDVSLFTPTYDAILTGEYYGGVLQPPQTEGKLAFETAVMIAEGVDVPKEILFEGPVLTIKNAKDYDRPNW